MNASQARDYEMTVNGHLDDHWSDWLGGFTLTRRADSTTSLTGTCIDQAQLYGVIAGLRDVGVELLSLRTIEVAQPPTSLARPLRTQRLILRAATAEDAEATWRYRQLPEVKVWLAGHPATADGYLAQFSDRDRLATTVIVEHHDGTLLGDFMLHRHTAWAQTDVAAQAAGQEVELGWVLHPAHTGHGYATEAAYELLRHSFEDLHVHRVAAVCFAGNDASWRLMERLGMRREAHTRRDALHRSGHWFDSFTYALLSHEWPRLVHEASAWQRQPTNGTTPTPQEKP